MSGQPHVHSQPTHKPLVGNPDVASLLNCTKVVRLFVVGARSIDDIRASEHTTGADVFVFDESRALGPGSNLVARSMGTNGEVVDHRDAHVQNPGGVVRLSARDGDQIEWQCDVEFMIERIEMGKHAIAGFETLGYPPANPFRKELALAAGGPCAPIRSGPINNKDANEEEKPWKQLYKAHFLLKIGKYWRRLDPDFACGSPTP